MPTYQYRCTVCDDQFELRQSFSDDPVTSCPDESCGGDVKKVFGNVGIAFKGSGFYETDYKRAGREKKKDSVDGKSGGDASGKSESKPKSGTEAKKGSSGSDSGKGATKKADS